MTVRRLSPLLAAGLAIGAVLAVPTAARADDFVLVPLDNTLLPTSADLAPARLIDCTAIPGGASATASGWLFSQPYLGPAPVGYALSFVDTGAGASWSIGIDPGGVGSLAVDGVAKPLPPAVAGSLIAGAAWLRTPPSWVLTAGTLKIQVPTTDLTGFALAHVCPAGRAAPPATVTPPPPTAKVGKPLVVPATTTTATAAPRPSPGPGRAGPSGSPHPSGAPAVRPAGPPPLGGPPPRRRALPITGSPVGLLIGAAVVLGGAGLLLRLLARRRATTGTAEGTPAPTPAE